MFFGFSEGQEVDPEDEDLQLIPNLVDLVVIPKLTGRLSNLNFSTKQIALWYFMNGAIRNVKKLLL